MSRGTGDAVDLFQRYMRDVRRQAGLDAEEEERLTLVLEDGRRAAAELASSPEGASRRALAERERLGREARDRIVLGNLRFVVHVATRFVGRRGIQGLELLDLIQEGNLGLLRAAEQFESGRGTFSTFAARWIWRSFDRAVRDQSRIVRVPVHVHEKLDRLRQEEGWYLGAKGRPPTPEELAGELETDVAGLAELRRAEQDVISADQPVAGDEDEDKLVYWDVVEDPEAAAFVQRAEDRQWLAWLLAGLDERRRRILVSQLGLEMTLDEIGRQESLSRERVRQLARDAFEKVRR